MRFTWTFLAGAALLGAFALGAQIEAQNPVLAQFSSAPDDNSNPILRLPAPPRPGAPRITPPLAPRFTPAPKSAPKAGIPSAPPRVAPVSKPRPTPVPALEPRFGGQNPLRVGLSTAGGEIRVYFPGGARLFDRETKTFRLIAPGDTAVVAWQTVANPAKSGAGPIAIRGAGAPITGLRRAYFAVQGEPARVTTNGANARYGRPYRGDLEVFPQKLGEPVKRRGPLALVNILPLESYLKGVVPWEMDATAPLEALKAQAICARTKTLDFVRSKRFARGDFEICDYDACQGYPGAENEKPATTQAVESTKGLAIYHRGRPIDAVYSTNSGGITANARDVWPGGAPIPYLQSVPDFAPDSPLAKWWQMPPSEAKWAQFCAGDFASFARPDGVSSTQYEARKYRWKEFVSVADLAKAFEKEGFGNVDGLVILERASSGRIKRLGVAGSRANSLAPSERSPGPTDVRVENGSKNLVLEGDGAIRSMFSKRLGSTTALPSSLFTISPVTDTSGKLTGWNLLGAGWGHGVGMCQRGAQNHAKAGWDARRILNHYYRGVEIR